MRVPLIVLILLIGIESKSQVERIDTLFFEKQLASLNSSVLVSLSQLQMENNKQVLLKQSAFSIDSSSLLFENCLFQRRAQTLKAFLINQGIDSNQILIKQFNESLETSNVGPKQELWLFDLDSNDYNVEYNHIAYAIAPKSWQKKTGPERGR